MSFFKKLSETVKDTATSVGAKSADLLETGKLKLKKNQLEGKIKDKKTEIGEMVYQAYKQNTPPDEAGLAKIFTEIKDLEEQIAAIDDTLGKQGVQAETQPLQAAQTAPAASAAGSKIFCTDCGQELSPGAKFCNNCGKAL